MSKTDCHVYYSVSLVSTEGVRKKEFPGIIFFSSVNPLSVLSITISVLPRDSRALTDFLA